MATRELEFLLRVKGQEDVKTALDGITGAVDRTTRAENGVKNAAEGASRAIEAQSRSTKQATSAIDAATQGFGKFGSTIGIAAQGIGRFNQGAGQIVGVVGNAAGSIASMTAAFGPMGLIIGGVSAAFGVLSAALDTSRRDMERTAAVAETTTQAIEGMAEAIRRAAREARQLRELESGGRGVTETEQLRDVRYQQLNAVERLARRQGRGEEDVRLLAQAMGQAPETFVGRSDASIDAIASAFLRQAQQNARTAESALDRAVARQAETGADSVEIEEGPVQFVGGGGNIAIVNYGAELGMSPQQALATFEMRGGRVVFKRRRGAGGARAQQRREAEEYGRLLAEQAGIAESQRRRGGTQLGTVDLDAAHEEQFAKDQARIQGLDEMEREAHQRRLEEHQERAEAWTREHDARVTQLEEQAEMWGQIGAAAVEVGVMVAKGDRQAFVQWAQQFALRQLGLAGEEAAKAIGYAIEAPPLAAAHAAAAAKHLATAALFGAVGGAVGGGGRGGGGSSGRAARADRVDRSLDGGGGTSVTVVFPQGTMVASTKRELADLIERTLDTGRSVRR